MHPAAVRPRRPVRAFVDDDRVQSGVLALIVLNALCMGAEATPAIADVYGDLLGVIFIVSQLIFVLEIALRLWSFWPTPAKFFRDSWNTFDFTVVALSLLPAVGSVALVARLLRVFRVLRVFSASDTLRGFFTVDDRDSRATVLLQATAFGATCLYLFGLCGFHLFGEVDGARWASLGRALSSVFDLLTFRGSEALAALSAQMPVAAYAFTAAVFIVIGAIVLNTVRCLGGTRVSPGRRR